MVVELLELIVLEPKEWRAGVCYLGSQQGEPTKCPDQSALLLSPDTYNGTRGQQLTLLTGRLNLHLALVRCGDHKEAQQACLPFECRACAGMPNSSAAPALKESARRDRALPIYKEVIW